MKQTFKTLWDPDFLTSLWGFNQFLPSTYFLARAWTDAMEQKGSYLSFSCKHSFLVFFLFSSLSYYLNFVNCILAVLFRTVKKKKQVGVRDGSVVKRTSCSCRGPKVQLSFQHLHQGAHNRQWLQPRRYSASSDINKWISNLKSTIYALVYYFYLYLNLKFQ